MTSIFAKNNEDNNPCFSLLFFFSVNLLDLFLRIKLLGKIGSTLVDPQQKKKKKKERKKNSVCCCLACPYRSVHFRRWGLFAHAGREDESKLLCIQHQEDGCQSCSATIFTLWCWVITCLLPWFLVSFLTCKVSGIKWDHRVRFLLALTAYDFSSA